MNRYRVAKLQNHERWRVERLYWFVWLPVDENGRRYFQPEVYRRRDDADRAVEAFKREEAADALRRRSKWMPV